MKRKQTLVTLIMAIALMAMPILTHAASNKHPGGQSTSPTSATRNIVPTGGGVPNIPPTISDNDVATANGIYVIDGIHKNVIDAKVMQAPVIDGVVATFSWSSLEPTEGHFDWSSVDKILVQAAAGGKKVSLILGAGWQTPQWVYSAGAQQFKFVWDQVAWGPRLCSTVAIPVPWDPIYLAKWDAVIAAAGARYNSNPTIASVKVTGLNSKTQELFLPTSVHQTISSGSTSCVSNDDVANWQAAGYTRLQAESAWDSVMQSFARAFPDKRIEAMLIPGGFPAIDDHGNRFSGAHNQDQLVTTDILSSSMSDYPSQFTIQNDGWSAAWMWATEAAYAHQVVTGYQELSALKTQTPAAITAALNTGAMYLEFYESDAVNPSFESALAAAHQLLG